MNIRVDLSGRDYGGYWCRDFRITAGYDKPPGDPDKIDFTTYVIAHEIGHQYWAHQVIGAAMQGETMSSETLAQYSALMVMKHLYGPDKIRRFLKYELDNYLRSRQSEVGNQRSISARNLW